MNWRVFVVLNYIEITVVTSLNLLALPFSLHENIRFPQGGKYENHTYT